MKEKTPKGKWLSNPDFKKRSYSYQDFRFFSLLLTSTAFFSMLGVATINWLINPYGVFTTPEIKNINHIKPKKEDTARIYKAFEIRRDKPETIVFGSSRAEEGLTITHESLTTKETVAYNAGFQAGNPYEILQYLKLAMTANPNLKRVVLGIDFFMFNEFLPNQETFSEVRLQPDYPTEDAVNFLLSFDALNSSKNTVLHSIRNSVLAPSKTSVKGFSFWIKEFLVNEQLYAQYELSESRLSNFRQIVELCQENNVELALFISPIHATLLETIAVAGLSEEFHRWKREVSAIAPVWDFAYHNTVTTEAIAPDMKYYFDSSHYSQEAGNLVLNRLYSRNLEEIPQDFGVLLTPENVEAHLIANRQQQVQWRQNQPSEVKLVQQIESKLQPK